MVMELSEWTTEVLCSALSEEKWIDPRLIESFRNHAVDAEVLLELTWEDLSNVFGVTQFGAAKKLIRNFHRFAEAKGIPAALPAVAPSPLPPVRVPLPDTRPATREAVVPQPLPRSVPSSLPTSTLPTPSAQKGTLYGELPLFHRKPMLPPLPQEQQLPSNTPEGILSSDSTTSRAPSSVAPLATSSVISSHPDSAKKSGGLRPPSAEASFSIPSSYMPLTEYKKLHEPSYSPGILEVERRYIALKEVFKVWEGISVQEQTAEAGHIPYEEMKATCLDTFPWGQDPLLAEANFRQALLKAQPSAELQGLCFKTFTAYMLQSLSSVEPRQCDAALAKIRHLVGAKRRAAEKVRRRKMLLDVFTHWDSHDTGIVSAEEVSELLRQYNSVVSALSLNHLSLSLKRLPEESSFDAEDFVDALWQCTENFDEEGFDIMVYRLMRCVDDLTVMPESPRYRGGAVPSMKCIREAQRSHRLCYTQRILTPRVA